MHREHEVDPSFAFTGHSSLIRYGHLSVEVFNAPNGGISFLISSGLGTRWDAPEGPVTTSWGEIRSRKWKDFSFYQ